MNLEYVFQAQGFTGTGTLLIWQDDVKSSGRPDTCESSPKYCFLLRQISFGNLFYVTFYLVGILPCVSLFACSIHELIMPDWSSGLASNFTVAASPPLYNFN
jgi:hypothetical protein